MEPVSMKRLTIENSFPTDNIYPGTLRMKDGRFCLDIEEIREGYTFWDRDTQTQYRRVNDEWVKVNES